MSRRYCPDPYQVGGKPRRPVRSPEEHRQATSQFKGPPPEYRPIAFVRPFEFSDFLRRLGFRSYSDYLLSPLWFGIRAAVLKKAKKRCSYCGRTAWQVHHEFYSEENLKGLNHDGLAATCARCHDEQHGKC